MHRSSISVLLAAVASVMVTTASAALPQPGLWAFDGESNGKPGRGLQIDRQNGDRIIVSYFGYRADGSSMFLQAGGNVEEDGQTFSAELNEYKNGRAIGGDVRTGELAQTLGTVKMEFFTSSEGSITLPGEEKRLISRIAFNENKNRLNNQFYVTQVALSETSFSTSQDWGTFMANGDQLEFQLPLDYLRKNCLFKGNLMPDGIGYKSAGHFYCGDGDTSASAPMSYRLNELTVDHLGFLSGMLYTSDAADMANAATIKLSGTCFEQPDVFILGVPGQGDRCSAERLK